MKTLTVNLTDPASQQVVARVRMSSHRMMEAVIPQSEGSAASGLDLPSEPADLVTLACLAATAADKAGLIPENIWQGRWELEHSTPENREDAP